MKGIKTIYGDTTWTCIGGDDHWELVAGNRLLARFRRQPNGRFSAVTTIDEVKLVVFNKPITASEARDICECKLVEYGVIDALDYICKS